LKFRASAAIFGCYCVYLTRKKSLHVRECFDIAMRMVSLMSALSLGSYVLPFFGTCYGRVTLWVFVGNSIQIGEAPVARSQIPSGKRVDTAVCATYRCDNPYNLLVQAPRFCAIRISARVKVILDGDN
jgi:hypothetical protein